MKIVSTVCLAAAFACLALPTWAADSCNQKSAKQYIHDSESAWAESVATKDASVVARILADDFVGVTPQGKPYGKQEMVAWTAKGGPYVSNHLEYVHIHFIGDTAIAQGTEGWTKTDGTRGRWIWLDTWVCRAGNWQIVSAADIETGPRDQPLNP